MVIWKKLILGLVLLLALSAVHASDIGVADDSQESISVDNLALEDISDDSQAEESANLLGDMSILRQVCWRRLAFLPSLRQAPPSDFIV